MKKRFLTYSLMATLLLPAILQQGAEANESTQIPVNSIKTEEKEENQELLKRSKIKAEDIYKKTELSMASEQASFTTLADWAIVELILEGRYGDTDDEIKSRLTKEKHDVESIMDSVRQARLEKIKTAKPLIDDFQYVKKVEAPEKVEQGGNGRKLIALLDEDGNETLVIEEKETSSHTEEKETSSHNSESKQTEVSEKTEVIPAYPHKEFKSYMSWTALHPESAQGKFSAQAVADPETAIMTYNGRYLVALGFAYADYVGQEIDIVMESGQIIHAVVGDFKAAEHTDEHNSTHLWDGSVVEFVVSSNSEAAEATKGTGSYNIIFPGKVKEFRK